MPTATPDAPSDALRRIIDDTVRAWDPVWQAWSAAMSSWPSSPPEIRGGHHHGDHHHGDHHHGGGGCGHDHPDHGLRAGCHSPCDCCVDDADLVVRTRLGESRVVPLTISNEWRRERTVEVEVGEFAAACHEDALVRVAATTRPKGPVTLAPCSRLEVGILLRTAAVEVPAEKVEATAEPTKATAPAKKAATRTAAARTRTLAATEAGDAADVASMRALDVQFEGRAGALPDVACCTTMYADVHVAGCGRPLRLAVVVSPLHCGSYEVDCHCGCC
jgi:hypothetical protein